MLKQHLQYVQKYTDNESAMSFTQNSLLLVFFVVVMLLLLLLLLLFLPLLLRLILILKIFIHQNKNPAAKKGRKQTLLTNLTKCGVNNVHNVQTIQYVSKSHWKS